MAYKFKIIFIVLFFIFLFGMGISLNFFKTTSEEENRKLLTFANVKSVAQLDKFLTDHFVFREHFIKFTKKINHLFPARLTNFASEHIIQGSNGYNFLNNNRALRRNLYSVASYQNKTLLTNDQEHAILKNIKEISAWATENNIKSYIAFPPDNMRSCDQFVPAYILRKNQKSAVQILSEKIHSDIHVVPLEDKIKEMAKKTNEPACYKTDSHWTEFAAFTAYQEIIKEIQKDFPDLYIAQETDFNVSKISTPYLIVNYTFGRSPFLEGGSVTLVWNDEVKKTLYKHYMPKMSFTSHFEKFRYNSTNPNGKYNAYIISDSFGANTLFFFSSSFKEVNWWNFNRGGGIYFNERKKEMKESKTDILIFLISDLKLRDLLRIYK